MLIQNPIDANDYRNAIFKPLDVKPTAKIYQELYTNHWDRSVNTMKLTQPMFITSHKLHKQYRK